MIKIEEADLTAIPTIHQLANEIWWLTYENILSKEQIAFMLAQMYAEESLKQQMEQGHIFLLLSVGEVPKGFACYSKTITDKTYKLQKIYLHPDQQGKGTGKALLKTVESAVKALGANILSLNVNRGNKARLFYEKMGYQIIEEVDIPYFDYVMDDYVMEKKLA